MIFDEIHPKDLTENAIRLICLDWMLVTSGQISDYNMMTASWGGLGMLWHKPVCFIVVRPSRHTFNFLEKNDNFTLSFFTKDYRDVLNFCGTNSGRDVNKMTEVDLTPLEEQNTVYFEEAKIVLICKKLYSHDFNPEILPEFVKEKVYKSGDYHRLFIGEILTCYKRKDD
ncbi:MAG: flavin reductase family protein [Asgard group archaeon]|nr:flavin reductase family protein [Asgard group archaeon]